MNIKERVSTFKKLGEFLNDVLNDTVQEKSLLEVSSQLTKLIDEVHVYNGWFTKQNVTSAIRSIVQMLDENMLEEWVKKYPQLETSKSVKQVGVIMAGNIPLVGFHDFLCVLVSGNKILAKLSSDDDKLLPLIAMALIIIEPRFESQIHFADGKLEKIDAIIATGSNNSARYFEYYFSKYPHIIRKNRNGVAVITGNETEEQLKNIGKDIFQYYGLGCRNVSKIMVPTGYKLDKIFEAVYEHGYVMDNKKYFNNYEYHRTVYLMNSIKFLDNNFVMMKEDIGIASPIGVLYYEWYSDIDFLKTKLKADSQNIQCVVSISNMFHEKTVDFGQTQEPSVFDYADGIDVLDFMSSLN